jgi:hypothetical protein
MASPKSVATRRSNVRPSIRLTPSALKNPASMASVWMGGVVLDTASVSRTTRRSGPGWNGIVPARPTA